MKITDLSGLEHCKALAQLELPNNEIKDLSPSRIWSVSNSWICRTTRSATSARLVR